MDAPDRFQPIKVDNWDIKEFIKDPKKSVLKLEMIHGEKVVRAEERGLFTWIKAHLPTKFFGKWVGNYNLKDIHAHLKELSQTVVIPDDFNEATNKVIDLWNRKNEAKAKPLDKFDTQVDTNDLRKRTEYIDQEKKWGAKCYQYDPRTVKAFDYNMSLMDKLYRRKISPDKCPFDKIFTLRFIGVRFLWFTTDGPLGWAETRDKAIKESEKPLFIIDINPERLVDQDSEVRKRGITKVSAKDLTSDDIRDFLKRNLWKSYPPEFPVDGMDKELFLELMRKCTFVCIWEGDDEHLINLLGNKG